MMDHATAQLDTSSPPHLSDIALNALNIAQLVLPPMLALAANLTSPSSTVPALAPTENSSTPTGNVFHAQLAANLATAQPAALFATLLFCFKMYHASLDAPQDTTNLDSPA
jgi:hypothetical protein